MRFSKKIRVVVGLFCLVLIVSACNLAGGGEPSAPLTSVTTTPVDMSITEAAPSSTGDAAVPPEHRIGVRFVGGVGEFYNRDTGEKFIPRGNNYVRLDPQKRANGDMQTYHSVFDPELYDRPEITTAFQEMHELGYNTVRVFVSQNTIGTSGGGLNEETMNNIVDFLALAKEYDLYVIFTQDWLPGGKYGRMLNEDCCDTFNMMNANFLPPAGLRANIAYFQDFVQYLIDHDAALDMVFSYQLRNELYFNMDFPPLSMTSGLVTALDGKTYDMANMEDKKRMVDNNMVLWMDEVRAAILEIDPTALVSVGFFWPQEPNPARVGDERYINTAPAIWDSELDFVDLHPYPAAELSFEEYVENFGINGMQEKPIVMGEFGATTQNVPSVSNAASILMEWQVKSCEYGFDGWLLWTWDLYETNDFYSAKSGEGQIGDVLAPVNRADACQLGQFDFFENNVALNKSVTASRSLADEPPTNAVDGSGAQWGSAAPPIQWIQIDLGQPYTVNLLRLQVAQYPEGATAHDVYAGSSPDTLTLVHTFDGETVDNQLLEFQPDVPLTDVQYVRVTTTKSPSWVSWREIEVIVP